MAVPDLKVIDGIKCYAPELIRSNDFYPAAEFAWLHQVEGVNFWFRARNKILHWLFQKYIGDRRAKVLEIGCGMGGILQMLSSFPNLELGGAEISLDYLKVVKERLPQVSVMQMDVTNMPFREEFDAVGAFDVIEHIDADAAALANIHQSLKPGGLIFITVPQHQWLWSADDVAAFHKRRYTRRELLEKVRAASFDVIFCSSFVFTLLPAMALFRLLKKKSGTTSDSKPASDSNIEFNLPPVLNQIGYGLMMLDLWLMKIGLRLPAGGSLTLVARKK